MSAHPRSRRVRLAAAIAAAAVAGSLSTTTAGALDQRGLPPAAGGLRVVRSIASLPARVVSIFGDEQRAQFEQAPDGSYLVLDRAAHAVYALPMDRQSARKIVDIGHEDGSIFLPTGIDVGPDGSFAVLDRPGPQTPRARVQVFDRTGRRLWGFSPDVTLVAAVPPPGGAAVNPPLGAGAIQYTGTSVLVSHPQSGRLIAEYSPKGAVLRTFGNLRRTGVERDPAAHTLGNAGMPLIDPAGGFYYVFVTGEPRFQKYDANGTLVFERVVTGLESTAPADRPRPGNTIRTAAVAPDGTLWLTLANPLVYVYDRAGINTGVVQLRGDSPIRPTGMSFTSSGRLLVTPGFYEFDPRR